MLPLSTLILLLPFLGAALAAPKPPTVKRPGMIHRRKLTGSVSSTNPGATPPTTTASKANVWASLSFDEAASVKQWLHQQTSLNLTAVEDAGEWDNQILTVDTLVPKKADALSYLDGNGTMPERWAHASIVFGQYEEPYVQTFRVGPLPISDATTVTPNVDQTTAKDAKIRVNDQTPSGGYMKDTLMEIKDVMSDLLDTKIDTIEDFDENFYLFGIDPLWYEDGRVINWVQPWRLGPMNKLPSGAEFRWDDATLLPQGVYFGFDVTGRDKSKWSVLGIYYGGEFYSTLDAFRSAWQSPDFVKYKVNVGGDWSNTDKNKKPALPYDTLPPPQHIQPGGQRFEMDADAGYVKWMDFEFYTTFTRDTGLRFYDIKFQGKRIMYELGLQEAIAQYAGQDPVQSGVSYLDSYYGFAPYAFNLIPGYDVPTYAACMKAIYHEGEESTSHDCGITLFEMDLGYPMSRHTTGDYVTVTKNIGLVVRTVNTFDTTFMLDGTIEVLVRASGYIQSAFYAKNEDYGYQIHDALSGSMHDHILNFKADIEICGSNNTMVKHIFEPIETTYPWSNVTKSTMHLARKEIKSEDEGKMNWSPNAREKVIIVNKDVKNKYGEEPGYLVMPSRGGGMYTTTPNNTNLGNSQEFGKFAYYLTKYKDSEIHAASPWNAYSPWDPLINFGEYFDGESLDQEDLVLWFNLGMHHVPHTGDLPNTVFTTAQSAMVFTPHNYILGDASRDTSQLIRINFDEDKATDVETFGQEPISGDVNLAQVAWDPYNYYGDLTTRKFPYDGLNKDGEDKRK